MKILIRLLKQAGKLNFILLASVLSGILATLFQVGIISLSFSSIMAQLNYFPWLILLGLAIVSGLCRFGEQYLGHLVAFKILSKFRNLTYQKIMQLSPAKLDGQHSSDILKLLVQDIEKIEIFYAHTLSPILIAVIVTLAQVIFFWMFSPFLGIVALIAYAVMGCLLPVLNAHTMSVSANELSQIETINQRLLSEMVSGKFELQQYQAVESKIAEINHETQEYWRLNQIKSAKQERQSVLMQLTLIVSLIIFLMVDLKTTSSFVAVLIFPFTFGRVLALASLPGSLAGGMLAAKKLFNWFDEKPVVSDQGQLELNSIKQIQLDNVDFAYPSRANDVILANASLQVNQGERIGLIGKSGEGKSTIVKLIMRWYQAQQGKVSLNTIDNDEIKLAEQRHLMNYVSQNAQIFATTIRENLVLRKSEIKDNEIWEVLKWVHLDTLIKNLPEQLATGISASKPILSAGELQRLELARALVNKSSLLILDEPTSNLDVLNEAIILNAVKQHYDGTVIIVTHRMSTLSICDRVLRLNQGQLEPA